MDTRNTRVDAFEAWSTDEYHKATDNPYFASQEALYTEASINSFQLGTGSELLNQHFQTIVENVNHELIMVTCFWKKSESSNIITDVLRALSARVTSRNENRSPGDILQTPMSDYADKDQIRVRICFSSLSPLQMLLHTWSSAGKIYRPQDWPTALGLPASEELPGLDIQVKSIFLFPTSVMHPKFFIMDRELVLSPSHNISWENWFEGVIDLQGPVVDKFVHFWESFWCHEYDPPGWNQRIDFTIRDRYSTTPALNTTRVGLPQTQSLLLPFSIRNKPLSTIFLPSQYHRSLRYCHIPFLASTQPPRTPLNMYLLYAIANARNHIFLQTPNVTSPPLLRALEDALARGVNIEIITNENLMVLEQLLTSGTTTYRCLKKLYRIHNQMLHQHAHTTEIDAGESGFGNHGGIGHLRISIFQNSAKSNSDMQIDRPVATHLKLTIIDSKIIIFGSGNMDRASWFTSQELGVAIASEELARHVEETVKRAVNEYVNVVYDN